MGDARAKEVAPTAPGPAVVPAPFARVVCGVDGTRSSAVAVEHALAAVGRDGTVEFVCFTDSRGTGATHMAGTGVARAARALEAARRAAAELGVDATAERLHHPDPRRGLLEHARDSDLLVLGAQPGSRAGGIMIGSTATLALHASSVPALIARPLGGRALAERVLVATTGSGAERVAARTGAALAASAGGSLILLHVEGPSGASVRHELALEASDAIALTGTEPVVVTVRGHGAAPIVRAAGELEATLLVLGSRGLTGLRALSSVSERASAGAHCSVLVLRAPA